MEKNKLPESATITLNQIETLKIYAREGSYYRVARKMHKSPPAVGAAIQGFKENWPRLMKLVEEVRKYDLEKIIATRVSSQENLAFKKIEKRWEKGYHVGKAPYGYRKDHKDDLVQVPEEAQNVKKIFEEYDKGKDKPQLAKETGLLPSMLYRMLHKPVYIGKVPLKGRTRKGRHKAIIEPDLFNRIQEKLKNESYRFGARPLPYGYKYENGAVTIVPEQAEKIRQMFEMCSESKGPTEIGRQLRMESAAVHCRIRNPFYAAKKKVKGKWEDLDHEAIIDFDTWIAASSVHIKGTHGLLRKTREIKNLNRNRILRFMGNQTLTAPEIAKGINLHSSAVRNHLRRLVKEEIVEKIRLNQNKDNHTERFQHLKWRIKG